jgi:hypothetical protein
MSYRIAGIDVHKKMLAIAVADVEVDGDFQFERQKVGTTPIDLRRLADWRHQDRHSVRAAVTDREPNGAIRPENHSASGRDNHAMGVIALVPLSDAAA